MAASKIICVWGSPGSGKTITALAVAAKLAEKKKNTIVINCDKSIPALKVFCPMTESNVQNSIGPLLMSGQFDDGILAGRMLLHPDSEYLCFMGLAPGDTYITYPQFDRENIIKLINGISKSVDYIVIDGSSVVLNDMLTLTMLELADVTIRIITPDNKGIVFLNATAPIFQDFKFRFEQHIKVLGNIKDISPVPETIHVVGNFDFMLPYSHEVESKYIGGELIQLMKRTDGIEFEDEISKLAERLLNLE